MSRKSVPYATWLWFTIGWTKAKPYLRTSLNQLTVGLLLEENPVVLEAIRAALLKLMELESWPSLQELHHQNLSLQKELTFALADFFATESPEENGEITEETWRLAAAVSGFRPLILQTLIRRVETLWQLGKIPLPRLLAEARLRRRRGTADSAAAVEVLRKAAVRLHSNVPVAAEAILRFHNGLLVSGVFLCGADFRLRTTSKLNMDNSQLQDTTSYEGLTDSNLYSCEFQGADFYSANLEGAALFSSGFEETRLSAVNLQNADLQYSRLAGATLDRCKLDGTKLYGAKIDATTEFSNSNWWAADFTRDGKTDEALLAALHDRVLRLKNKYQINSMFGDEVDLTNWLDKAHPSVREFVATRHAKQATKPVAPGQADLSS